MDSLDYFDWLELVSRTFDMRLLAKAEDNLAIQPRTATQKYRVQDTEHGPVVMEYNMDQDPRHDAWEPSGDADAIREVLEEHRRETGRPRTASESEVNKALADARKAYGIDDLDITDCSSCFGDGRHKDCQYLNEPKYQYNDPRMDHTEWVRNEDTACCDENGKCKQCNGRGIVAMIPWDKVVDKVRKEIKPKPEWSREFGDPRSAKLASADPSNDSCSACGGTGDCPRNQPSGSHYQCDLCHGDNHCGYCGRRPEACNRCGNMLRQFDDGHFEHRAGWDGFEPGQENLRNDVDPRGPLLIPCDKPEPSTHQACKGWGCDDCNQSGRTDGDPNGW